MTDAVNFEDWQAICSAKARYCRYLDGKEWDKFAALFTEDYELDVSEGTGMDVIKGRDKAIASIRGSIEQAKTCHQVHTPDMCYEGDSIKVIWAMQDRVVWSEDKSLTGYGNYFETWVKEEGSWKISALKLTRYILEFQS